MVAVGVAHFVVPQPFVDIVPPYLPAPRMLVYVSGLFEVLGGVGLLLERTRRLAAWGLIALYVAIFPANIHMALHQVVPTGTEPLPAWALWARLPLQLVFIGWAHRYTRHARARRAAIGAAPGGVVSSAGMPAPGSARELG
jgi:uncharacterized membrane protein